MDVFSRLVSLSPREGVTIELPMLAISPDEEDGNPCTADLLSAAEGRYTYNGDGVLVVARNSKLIISNLTGLKDHFSAMVFGLFEPIYNIAWVKTTYKDDEEIFPILIGFPRSQENGTKKVNIYIEIGSVSDYVLDSRPYAEQLGQAIFTELQRMVESDLEFSIEGFAFPFPDEVVQINGATYERKIPLETNLDLYTGGNGRTTPEWVIYNKQTKATLATGSTVSSGDGQFLTGTVLSKGRIALVHKLYETGKLCVSVLCSDGFPILTRYPLDMQDVKSCAGSTILLPAPGIRLR